MEPVSFAFAVVGVFQTCTQGYAIVSDAYNAPSDAQQAARRIRIESAVLHGWGQHFDVLGQPPDRNEKLKEYIGTGPTYDGVFSTLCAISEIFVDIRRMKDKYGIVFDYKKKREKIPRDVEDLLNGRELSPQPSPRQNQHSSAALSRVKYFRTKMTVLAKCQWSLSGKTRISSLINELREYNDDLIRLCSWVAQAQINRGLPTVAIPGVNNYVALHTLANTAEDAAKENPSSPSAEGRRRIADMARFKARIKTPNSVSDKLRSRRHELDMQEFRTFRSNRNEHKWTTAVWLKSQIMVFIEWRTYGRDSFVLNDPTLARTLNKHELESLIQVQIQRLGDFLCTRDRPSEFRTLHCLGTFKDAQNQRYGFVYQVPRHLQELPPHFRPEDLTERLPGSLTNLFNWTSRIDLGFRFDAGRKLMESIIVMHACGWLHKDICSDNILFFPAKSTDHSDRVDNRKKDFGRLYVMGYGLSRPDDVDHREPMTIMAVKPLISIERSRSRSPARSTPAVNIYQHPDKVVNPANRYRHSYDVYSLGVVLLELGLWESLKDKRLPAGSTAYDYRSYLLEKEIPRLAGLCGSIYMKVVEECLTIQCADVEMEKHSQRKLSWDLIERLDMCKA